jgi:hypothetical protein
MSDLENRAVRAYFRYPCCYEVQVQPARVTEQEHNGRRYVTLANINGTFAVYRVFGGTPCRLRRILRWPSGLSD